jgi:heme-degrading monooxygenase HmoA
MPVLMIGEVPNLSEEVYAGMIGQMMPLMKAADGFIAHSAGPSPSGGWRVVESWDSEAQAQAWFDNNVKPNLPPGIVPNRVYFPLHTAYTK